MSYPDECPVFKLRCAQVTYTVEVVYWEPAECLDHRRGWVYVDGMPWPGSGPKGIFSTRCMNLRPLTPAAEELLAAIKQELGLE